MSDLNRTRKGRVRRNVAALVSAVALAAGGVAVPQVAGAYVQDDSLTTRHGDTLGEKPSASISLELSDATVRAGESTTAIIEVGSSVPFPKTAENRYGQSDATALLFSIELDKRLKANFQDPLDSNFRWNDGQSRPILKTEVDEVNNELTVEFAAPEAFPLGQNPGFTLELPVVVAEGVDPGTELHVAVGTEVDIRPVLDWTPRGSTMQNIDELEPGQDKCVRKATITQSFDNAGNYGTWIADLWLGTNSDFRLAGNPTFKLTGPDGVDLTSQVFRQGSTPFFTDYPQGQPEQAGRKYPNHTWLRKYDWRINENQFAGETWVPAGSKLQVEQYVSSDSCTFDERREFFSVNVASRNAPLFDIETARRTIVVQGDETPESPSGGTTPATTVTETVTTTQTPEPVTETVTETPSTTTTETKTTTSVATTTPTVTVPTTVVSTVPTTETTTEQTTVPTTVVTTEQTTVPTTVVTTEQTTVPTTVVTTEQTTVPTTVTETPEVSTETTTVTQTEDCGCEPTTVTETKTAEPVTETETETATVTEVETSTEKTTVKVPVPTTIRTTTTAQAPERSSIGDRVWVDENGDGKEDPGEKTGVPNVSVVITNQDGNVVTRTVTDKDGNWKVDVEPGEYTVIYELGGRTPSDKSQVERTIVIVPGKDNFDVDLGILPEGSVGDRVWNDEDGDGAQGEDEKGLENVVVLVSREGEPTRSAVTDENGDWKIEGLNPNAEYEVRFIKPEGWEVTGKVPGSDKSGLISKVTVKPNEYNDTYDLGLKKIDEDCDCEPVKPGRLGDRVWVDENGDGKEDPGEKTGVPDVTVIVRDKDGNEVTRTVTDENGNWKVDVTPGDYEVEYRPRDWKPTDPSQVIRKVTVEEGKEYLDLDLGVKPGEPAPSTPPVTVTQTVEKPAPTTTPKPWNPGLGEGGDFLDRCVANAVRSPFLYLVPVALLGAFGGELARPYMGAINEQVNKINAEFQAAIRRNSPEWGEGGQGARRDDPFAELRAQLDAANRQLQQIAADPNVQRFGTAAAGIIGLIAAGAVVYDWCSSEEGQAVTSIKGDGSSRKEKVTTVAPTVTTTETRN